MSEALVLQSDFGKCDGAVSAMYGVAQSVNKSIRIFDLTHDIPPFNIWEASYRLLQTVSYWPEKTVFVSVVDPGVGSDRRSIAIKTASDQYVITPDNGTLIHIKRNIGIAEARIIDESVNRLPQSGESHTFHGRDIYAYTGARLASNLISFEDVGPEVPVESVAELPIADAKIAGRVISGTIDVLDVRFGNVWTNIPSQLFKMLAVNYGETVQVTLKHKNQVICSRRMVYGRSFADCSVGEAVVYINSLEHIGIALNQKSFAQAYDIGTGSDWGIVIEKITSH
ncbi:hypothetical protein SAMN05421736_1083 [Evansella caseinilytica]|uniref:DNA-directed RNA polymerase subunit delta n=1 Tax=Evansella caseinilytica TaxID=1503961 RepID=A0A1H3RAR4_9BACI|nr:S-adenosyl-l-methionine hydroxide adenosyltransferase family protein [Evansella caseinilytica]SDZ22341.1 hypothetical protein SAMN05421736_1083 [Evansella caseinilytica]